MTTQVASFSTIIPATTALQEPSCCSKTANKIKAFFTRIEGFVTLFSLLAGAAVAVLWGVSFGLILGAVGLTTAIVIALCRSEASKAPAININFHTNAEGHLKATIDTERLLIRSVQSTEADHEAYAALFGDPASIEKYATGVPVPRENIINRIDKSWVKRWNEQDPYAGLAVIKKSTNEFVGHIVLGHGDNPGESEMAILFKKEHWGNKYGTEALTALFNEYAPATVNLGYLLDGQKLERIVCTGRPDNVAGCKIVEKLGMQIARQDEKYGAMRNHYVIELSELQKRTHAQVTKTVSTVQ